MNSDTSNTLAKTIAIKFLCLRKIECKQLYSRIVVEVKDVPNECTSLPNYTYCINNFNMSSDTFSPSKIFIKVITVITKQSIIHDSDLMDCICHCAGN